MPAKTDQSNDTKAVEFTRILKAPRDRVWQAWSTADELQKWWGPQGCKLRAKSLEFRPGGFFHYEMKFKNTPSMWGRFNYREISDGERIVWLNSFANDRGGIDRAPFALTFPMEVLNSAHFSEQSGKTIVTLRSTPFGATDEEIQGFESIYDSMVKGYGATLDQLEAHLGA